MDETSQQIVYSHQELTALIIRDKGIHEGKYDITIEFQLAVGGVGPDPSQILPGAMLGISRIGITRAHQPGPNSVDAAVVNPKKPAAKRAKPAAK